MSYRPCDLDTAEKVIEAMARALATARADGRREGLEMAAAHHDQRAEECAHLRSRISRYSEDTEEAQAWREFKTREDWHRTSATAIRAMMEKEGL